MSDLKARDGALINNWYVACLIRELKPKKPLQRVIYDSPFVLFRDSSGKAVCLPDRCLHRHAPLSKGVVIDGCLACPYHGWTYNSQGVVVEVPSEGPQGKRLHENLKLKSLPVVEQDECVWVWMGEGEPKTKLPPFRFPHFEDGSWAHYFMITDFENEVTHLVENFMDVPHTVFVHAGWFRNVKFKPVPITVETKAASVLVTYRQPQDKIGFTGRILNPKSEPMTHTDHFFMPNLTRVDYGFGSKNSFIIISQCTPVSALKSRVYTAIIYRIGPFTHLLKPFMRFYTRQVIEQDVRIMAIQAESFRHDFTCRFHATDADVVHQAIEKLREMGIKGDPRLFDLQETTEKEIWI